MTVTQAGTTTANQPPQIYFDEHTRGDRDAHAELHKSIRNGDTPPDSLSGMPAVKTSELSQQATPGQLSSAPAADGSGSEAGTVYFGGFISNESHQTIDGQAGSIHFFFKQSDEANLINHLKEEKLITDDINSFSDLGAHAIGVIENAVDEGVLVINKDGQLTTGQSSGESQKGASHVSRTDENGQIEETENPLARPKSEHRSATLNGETGSLPGATPPAGGDMIQGTPVELDGVEVTPTINSDEYQKINDLLLELGIEPADVLDPTVLKYLHSQKTVPLITVNEEGVISIVKENYDPAVEALATSDGSGGVSDFGTPLKKQYQEGLKKFKEEN